MRLAILRDYFFGARSAGRVAFDSACARLREAGASLDDVAIPHAGDVAAIYLHIVLTEAAAYHAKTLEAAPRITRRTCGFASRWDAMSWVKTTRARFAAATLIRREVDAALDGVDGLFLPALAIPAPKIGVPTVRIGAAEEPVRNVMLRCTQAFNVSGHPAITLPCGSTTEGLTTEGLPLGAQIIGVYQDTAGLLQVAQAVESVVATRAENYLGPGRSR